MSNRSQMTHISSRTMMIVMIVFNAVNDDPVDLSRFSCDLTQPDMAWEVQRIARQTVTKMGSMYKVIWRPTLLREVQLRQVEKTFRIDRVIDQEYGVKMVVWSSDWLSERELEEAQELVDERHSEFL